MPLTHPVEAAVQSDVGLVRHNNQDSFGGDDELGLYVVCDGMGGAAGGEVASSIATETFLAIARQEIEADRSPSGTTERALRRATAAANRAVCLRAAYDTRYRGMGSTLVAARIEAAQVTVVNVGDSRAYLLHASTLKQLTLDHSYVAEQVQRGLMTPEEAEVSSLQSVITRAIGADIDVAPDLFAEPLASGDTLLLTSDGLTRHVTDDEIATALSPANSPTAESASLRLIEWAKQDGGTDNITCFVIRIP